jgi:NADPH:quinone reductase
MKAAWYERVGPAADVLVVGEMPDPEPAAGEVRVRLHTSGVNPSDTKRRSGFRGRGIDFPRVVPHSDGAGVIDAVGSGVDAARIGERVWTYNARWQRPFGTAAGYVTLPADLAVPLPDTADFAAGACLAIPAITAHACLFSDGPIAGRTVLVTGGAGAVGHAAIQLAVWAGATVIATVSGEEKGAIARAAGAAHVVNYRTDDVAARVRELTGGAGVDRIVEVAFGANLPTSIAVLKEHGVIAAYGSDVEPEPRVPFGPLIALNATIRFVLMYSMRGVDRDRALADITTVVASGAMRPLIAARLPLDQIAAAHELIESGRAVGNVVIDVG